MTSEIGTDEADRALKAKHRGMWALGNYAAVAGEVIPELGPVLVSACGIAEGDRVLDVAAGSGNAAIPAALTGATVVASDLTPELFDAGRAVAAKCGAQLQWQEADAEALPYGDGEFDAVMSCVGVMFAPHHQQSALELVRVCRSGGTIGLINWTPEGFIGQMFKVLGKHLPPPAGAQPPALWGTEAHLAALFGERADGIAATRRTFNFRYRSAAHFIDVFRTWYGPVHKAFAALGAEKGAALERDLADLLNGLNRGGKGSLVVPSEYLEVVVTVR